MAIRLLPDHRHVDQPDRFEGAMEGYTWQVMAVNNAVLKQMGDPVFTQQSNNMGYPSVQVWKFQAVSAGSTVLKLG